MVQNLPLGSTLFILCSMLSLMLYSINVELIIMSTGFMDMGLHSTHTHTYIHRLIEIGYCILYVFKAYF